MVHGRGLAAVALLLALTALTACEVPEPTRPAGSAGTPRAALEGLGSPAQPLVMAFAPSADATDVPAAADVLARLMTAETGLTIQAETVPDRDAAVAALKGRRAHLVWLDTFAYLAAKEEDRVRPLLVLEADGASTVGGQIVVGADTGIDTLDDLVGRTFCRPGAKSVSGWILPILTLRAFGVEEVDLGRIVDAGSADDVIQAVYNGECDAGATFADARSAASQADVKDRVKVLAVTGRVPNQSVSAAATVQTDLAGKLADALQAIAMTPEGLAALQAAYQADGVEPVDDAAYDDVRATLEKADLTLEQLGMR